MSLTDILPPPSFHSLLLTSLVERTHPRCSSLAVKHLLSPHLPLSDPSVSNARDALLSAAELVFPVDLPGPLYDSDHDDHPTEPVSVPSRLFSKTNRALQPPIYDDVQAPPPLRLTRARSPFPTSPVSDSPPPSPCPADVQLSRAFDLARTLPLSSAGAYNALAEPRTESRVTLCEPAERETIQEPTSLGAPSARRNAALRLSTDAAPPRRANSLPRRPSSSPPPRIRSLGLPTYGREHTALGNERRKHFVHEGKGGLNAVRRRRNFRHVLLTAKTHVFAITSRDGSRQYVYSRPLSNVHAMVVVTTAPHTAFYVSALERIAARYALLVDEIVELKPKKGAALPSAKELWDNFVRFELLRCPPQVAKELTKALVEWLRTGSACGRHGFANDGLLRRTSSRIFKDHPELGEETEGQTDDERHSITWLASSATSSNRSSRAKEEQAAAQMAQMERSEEAPTFEWFGRKKERADGSDASTSIEELSTPMPWDALVMEKDASVPDMTRVLELTDATILFRHFSVRSLMSIVVALMEERRVCVVGPDTALVSRAVLAVDNLLRPFEWPHLLSPILLQHMLPVLGAPFPYLVGILCDHEEQTKELPLDEVIFANLETGKVSATTEIGELYRHIPRRVRNRLEKRLSRARQASLKQVSKSSSSPFVPTVSNTATSYFDTELGHASVDKTRPLLFRSKSQLRLIYASNLQNIWLEHGTVAGLDRSMRKFFAELLEDLEALKNEVATERDAVEDENEKNRPRSAPTVASFPLQHGKSENERRQLLRAFCETQMFMQWERDEKSDVNFGVTRLEHNVLRKRSTGIHFSSKEEKPYMSVDEERTHSPDGHMLSDFEFDEEPLNVDFEYMIQDKPLKRRLGKKYKARKNRTWSQLKSDTDGLSGDPREMLSDVEGAFYVTTDENTIRPRNLSTECVPDQEPGLVSKRAWLNLRRSAGRRVGIHEKAFAQKQACSPDDVFDDLETDFTGAEDSDDGSENEIADKLLPAFDGTLFSKERVRAWGRRAKHAIRT